MSDSAANLRTCSWTHSIQLHHKPCGLLPSASPFRHNPPPPHNSQLADLTFSFTPHAYNLPWQSEVWTSRVFGVWGSELLLPSRPVLVAGPGKSLGRRNHVLPQKHLRVSCHMSSGKLEEALVPFHLAGEPIRRAMPTPKTTLFICPNS